MTASTIFCYADIEDGTTLNQVLEQLRGTSIDGHDVLGIVLCDAQPQRISDRVRRFHGINLVLEGTVNSFGSYRMGPHVVTLCGRTYLGEPVTTRQALVPVATVPTSYTERRLAL